jgi:2-polyprenyl-3-methyl-5-hydroxy-6-metoxy-1,4-benzoquinol methylase
MERIDRKTMADLIAAYGTADTPRVYTHRNRLVGELFWRSHDRMLALSQSLKRGRVLDFGGGNGVLLRDLSKRFDEVVCVDLNADIAREVVRLYKLPNVQVMADDIFKLGLPDGHFDMVIAAQVLEHVLELAASCWPARRRRTASMSWAGSLSDTPSHGTITTTAGSSSTP